MQRRRPDHLFRAYSRDRHLHPRRPLREDRPLLQGCRETCPGGLADDVCLPRPSLCVGNARRCAIRLLCQPDRAPGRVAWQRAWCRLSRWRTCFAQAVDRPLRPCGAITTCACGPRRWAAANGRWCLPRTVCPGDASLATTSRPPPPTWERASWGRRGRRASHLRHRCILARRRPRRPTWGCRSWQRRAGPGTGFVSDHRSGPGPAFHRCAERYPEAGRPAANSRSHAQERGHRFQQIERALDGRRWNHRRRVRGQRQPLQCRTRVAGTPTSTRPPAGPAACGCAKHLQTS